MLEPEPETSGPGRAAAPAELRTEAPPALPARGATAWWLVPLLAFTAGATVANIYYCQPLLETIAATFRVPSGAAGAVATANQLGYAAGLLLLVPLGDVCERRGLIAGTTALSAAALAAVALAPGLAALVVASFATGAISITPQLAVPYAAGLASPERRGQTVGTVMSGLLVGILFSRTVSGFVGAHAGWRAVYGFAAGAMLLLAAGLTTALPTQHPPPTTATGTTTGRRLRYPELIGSLFPLLRREPVLRRHALVGACGFAAFSAFWTTLVFHLASLPGRHYGSETAGLFGLVGAAGALVAPVAGRLADRFGPRPVNGGALGLVSFSFGLMALGGGRSLGLLAAGTVFMDAGVQASHISNQTRVYALAPERRNRLNAVYMVSYFLGGSLGSATGAAAWAHAGWAGGVCAVGAGFGLAGVAALFLGKRRVSSVR